MNKNIERKLYSDPVPVETLINALEEKETDYHDDTIDSGKLFMDSTTGNMVVKNGSYSYDEYPMQDQAQQMLLMKLRMPHSYAKRCPTELLSENVNHWLAQYQKQLFVRFDRNEIRSVLTPKYNPVSNLEIVKRLYENSNYQDLTVRYEVTPSRFVAQFISPEKAEGVQVGDPCQYGIHLCNSETGYSSVRVKGLILRLICQNGLVSPVTHNSWSRTHRSQSEVILEELESTIETVNTELPRVLQAFYKTREILLPKPREIIEGISAKFKLSKIQQEEVQNNLTGNSLYNVINAYTHAGSHQNQLTLKAREELQEIGGQLISMDRSLLEKLAA